MTAVPKAAGPSNLTLRVIVGVALIAVALGAIVFWLYYRNYLLGTDHILPAMWRNPIIH